MDQRIAQAPPAALAKIDSNAWTAPFWAAAAEHRLEFPRCRDCARFRMPPTPFCPYCRSQAVDWIEVDGDGTLYSYTIVERAIIPGMEEGLPYVPAVIAFRQAGGVRLISNIVGSPLALLAVDAPVSLVWRDLDGGISLPVFRILSPSGDRIDADTPSRPSLGD